MKLASAPWSLPGPVAQRGSALVVGLIMLVVLTILAITGMNVASTELVMAGGEQDRARAFNAAEAGIERAARTLGDVPATPGAEVTSAVTQVEGSSVNAATGAAVETFQTTTRYRGSTELINNFNGNKIQGFHYEIDSVGSSARGATSNHEQGAYLVNPTFGQQSFGPL